MKALENKPSATFWTSLSHALEKQARDATKGTYRSVGRLQYLTIASASMFLQQTLTSGYPKLLRLFHDFFGKIAVHTDTVYTQNQQSPETVLVLRALSSFEALYTSRSTNRLNETVGQAFSGGARAPPAANEGINIARAVANELDSAKFDPLLVKTVARNISSSLDLVLSRSDALVGLYHTFGDEIMTRLRL
jgi:conserved oligomeric Golgi complex subunit 5